MAAVRFTSCQAPIAERFCVEVTAYVAHRLCQATEFVRDIPWQERLRRFEGGGIHVCWMCGLPYTRLADEPSPRVELLAAPVMTSRRYGDRPSYFSDVVVHSRSALRSFADLRGMTWSYNDEMSHSGYNAVRSHLARLGHPRGFFKRAFAAGSHEASLRLLLAGAVDGTAIDSTVLELLQQRDPDLGGQVRVVETLGPSPMPPWVVSRVLPPNVRTAVRQALLGMHRDSEGQAILKRGSATRFATVTDREYDAIRETAQQADAVELAG
jgi:ABC-type phosphate/phosphonate transport system substrate-binding protein